ncbi:hypothetical protein [Rhodopirellula europaea]|uniref:hypothetical protein n=1 Tax=Rhodopirellula europaea TaxID=1263866 RepID=UPI003D298C04
MRRSAEPEDILDGPWCVGCSSPSMLHCLPAGIRSNLLRKRVRGEVISQPAGSHCFATVLA